MTAHGKTFSFARSDEVQIPEEGIVGRVTVEMAEGADLEVLVKGPAGRPVPNARINLLGDGVPPVEIAEWAEEDGVLRLLRLPPGRYRIEIAQHPATLRAFAWTEAGGGPLDIAIER